MGFTGVYIIVLISTQNIRGGSNEYPQSMFWAEIWKISEFLSEHFHFLVVKFSVYLNRFVFCNEVREDLRPPHGYWHQLLWTQNICKGGP